MPQTKTEIQQLLEAAGMAGPRRRFGQNFMIDQNLLAKVIEAGDPKAGELVIEVGPGTGTLTECLLASGADVLAVEIDRDLAQLLRTRFADRPNFQLIQGDALEGKHELNAELLAVLAGSGRGRPGSVLKLIANLPYNIASPLIIELLIAGVDLLAFTVQKEVAQRLEAKADTENYGPLSVMAQMLGQVKLLRVLPPQAFWPAPKIDSALVRITRNDQLGAHAQSFSTFVHALFSARRKMLRKALSNNNYQTDGLPESTLEKRVEVLPPMELWHLYKGLAGEDTRPRGRG